MRKKSNETQEEFDQRKQVRKDTEEKEGKALAKYLKAVLTGELYKEDDE